jgi:osmotically inducible lipoprotein OsmB
VKLASSLMLILLLSVTAGCAHMTRQQQRTLSGAAIGAGAGAAFGAVVAGSPAVGAAVGGAVGAAAGALWKDVQRATR